MKTNQNPFIKHLSWNLGDLKIENTASLEILRTLFMSDISYDAYIDECISVPHRITYALVLVGCSYPGLITIVKVPLWKIVWLPSLLHDLEILTLKPGQQKYIENVQSFVIK